MRLLTRIQTTPLKLETGDIPRTFFPSTSIKPFQTILTKLNTNCISLDCWLWPEFLPTKSSRIFKSLQKFPKNFKNLQKPSKFLDLARGKLSTHSNPKTSKISENVQRAPEISTNLQKISKNLIGITCPLHIIMVFILLSEIPYI